MQFNLPPGCFVRCHLAKADSATDFKDTYFTRTLRCDVSSRCISVRRLSVTASNWARASAPTIEACFCSKV